MAKPVLKFTAVPYEIGDFKGYRPQLEPQNPVSDLDFCREVVTEKRLSMSAEELLHALEMVGEVGPKKVAEDGRPRAVTKLLKWNRYAQGKLESPTSPWNDSCKAVIRAQLLNDAEKIIDASFTNVNTGIGVKLDNVTWLGAKSVQNVIKVGADFGAYGRHMEFIAGAPMSDAAAKAVILPPTSSPSQTTISAVSAPREKRMSRTRRLSPTVTSARYVP